MTDRMHEKAIISAIVAVAAHSLNLKVCAEGVKNTIQIDLLRKMPVKCANKFRVSNSIDRTIPKVVKIAIEASGARLCNQSCLLNNNSCCINELIPLKLFVSIYLLLNSGFVFLT